MGWVWVVLMWVVGWWWCGGVGGWVADAASSFGPRLTEVHSPDDSSQSVAPLGHTYMAMERHVGACEAHARRALPGAEPPPASASA